MTQDKNQNRPKRTRGVSPEAKLVHGHRQVTGLAVALVGIAVVHGDQVNVTEDKTVVVVLLQSLGEAHVQQLGSVKDLVPILIPTNTQDENTHVLLLLVT